MSVRAITLTVVIVLLLAFWFVVDARATTCQTVDQVWGIEEGGPEPDTAKIDVTGALCSGPTGFTPDTSMSMAIRPTAIGVAWGFVYWQRGATVKMQDTNSLQWWRTPFAVKVCMIRLADWVCGPTARFSVNVRYVDTATQPPIRLRRWISNRNEFATDVHFAWTS